MTKFELPSERPLCASVEIKEWLRSSLEALRGDGNTG
jgi:hypothetical protein